jgi:hypothetical protein
MERIKGTVDALLAGLREKSLKNEFPEGSPELLLKNIFTKKELAHIKFGYFRSGTMGIKVEASSWLYYFSNKKEELLAQAQKRSPAVREIRFSIGEI